MGGVLLAFLDQFYTDDKIVYSPQYLTAHQLADSAQYACQLLQQFSMGDDETLTREYSKEQLTQLMTSAA